MTPPLQAIPASDILETATAIVRGAERDIRVTMDVAEERAHPLPEGYFSLLRRKTSEGVRLDRIGFGSDEDMDSFLCLRPLSEPNIRFFRAHPSDAYKRMMLVDGKHLLFAEDTPGGRRFYASQDPAHVRAFTTYFDEILARANPLRQIVETARKYWTVGHGLALRTKPWAPALPKPQDP